MFCTGAAPTVPGIPDIASMPARPSATAYATRASQSCPACTRSRAKPGRGDGIRSMPSREHAHDRAVEGLVADEQVGSAAEREPRVAVGPHRAEGVDELVGRGRVDHACGGAAGAQRRELRERDRRDFGHRSGEADAHLRLDEHRGFRRSVTVRSMRAVSSSTAPTFATTDTSAPVSGSTTTGRVNRTP